MNPAMNMFHYVYVLQNDAQEFHAGYALDLSHPMPRQGKSWKVVYCEAYLHLSDAMRRVKFLQSLQGAKLIKQKLRRYLWK